MAPPVQVAGGATFAPGAASDKNRLEAVRMSDDEEERFRIELVPPSPRVAAALVDALEAHGVRADWRSGIQNRGLARDAVDVAIGIIASGSYDAVKAGVKQLLERFPTARIKINGDSYVPRHKD